MNRHRHQARLRADAIVMVLLVLLAIGGAALIGQEVAGTLGGLTDRMQQVGP